MSQIFKIKIKNLLKIDRYNMELKIREETGKFPNELHYPPDSILYEGYNCYVPEIEYTNDSSIFYSGKYNVYFWHVYKEYSPYWKIIGKCTEEEIQSIIIPRIKRIYEIQN